MHFSPLPIEAIADARLSKNDLRILAALYYRNGNAGCFPSRNDLCELTGLFPQKVSAAITRLCNFGWVQKDGRNFILKVTESVTIKVTEPVTIPAPKSHRTSDLNSHRNGYQKSPNRLPIVTEPVTRNRTEENIRENEEREDPLLPSKFCPENFRPNEIQIRLLRTPPGVDIDTELEQFKLWEFKTPKTDWNRAFAHWLTNAKPRNKNDGLNPLERKTNELLGI